MNVLYVLAVIIAVGLVVIIIRDDRVKSLADRSSVLEKRVIILENKGSDRLDDQAIILKLSELCRNLEVRLSDSHYAQRVIEADRNHLFARCRVLEEQNKMLSDTLRALGDAKKTG